MHLNADLQPSLPRRGPPARLAPENRRVGIWVDVAALSAFCALTPLFLNDAIGAIAPALFILFTSILVLRHPQRSTKQLKHYQLLLIYPVYAILSTFWSNYPGISLRHSVQLLMTFGLSLMIFGNITSRQFMRIIFFGLTIGVLLSLAFGRLRFDGVALGIFNSKNSYAASLAICFISAFGVAGDEKSPLLLRLFGGLMVLACTLGIFTANSAGTVLTLAPALLAFTLLMMLRWLPPAARMNITALAIVVMVLLGLFAYGFSGELMAEILTAAGKDTTLTGRTDLWNVAHRYIADNPLFGIGYQAFWVKGYNPAEELWRQFLITGRSGFNFHSTYMEIAVQLGMVGVTMGALILAASVLLSIASAIRTPSGPQAFFSALTLFMILKSFGEVGPLFEFRGWTPIVIAAIVFSLRSLREARSADAPPVDAPAAESTARRMPRLPLAHR